MVGRLVITSVERGLGAGPGFQPVLRTKGLRPAVAERLRLRSAYAHPYPFGDRRNPVVYFHRIETVAGQRLHVLARVGDAGSDYSGRSNRISDLLVLDEAECQSRPGGPAAVAESFSWFQSWSGMPREIEAAASLAADGDEKPNPRACSAWLAASGDAGWAGELAKSFLDGRSTLVIVRPEDDVLRLFAEAMRLLPPGSRWNVTFTTCELEPFSASWRAVRSDITRLPRYADGQVLTIDLTGIGRENVAAPDHAYSQFARGSGPVPWAAEKIVVAPDMTHPSAGASSSVTVVPEPIARAISAGDVGAAILRRRERQRPIASPTRVAGGNGGGAGRRIAANATLVIPLCLLGLGVAYIAWIQLDPQAATTLQRLWAQALPAQPKQTQDLVDLDDREKRQERERLAAKERADRESQQKAEQLAKIREEEEVIAKKEAVVQRQRIAAAAEQARQGQRNAQAAAQLKEQQEAAIQAFRKLPSKLLLTPIADPHNPLAGLERIDVGAYPVDHLIDPSFALATPAFRVDGGPASLAIAPIRSSPTPAWRVTARIPKKHWPTDQAVSESVPVCELVVSHGHLALVWDPGITPESPAMRLLQNSLLIATCRNAESDHRESRRIDLLEPIRCSDISFDLLSSSNATDVFGLKGRIDVLDPSAIKPEITIRHPWLDRPGRHDTPFVQQALTLQIQPGVTVVYDEVGHNDTVTRQEAKLCISGALSVDLGQDKASWTPVVQFAEANQKPAWVLRVFTCDRLQSYLDGNRGELLTKYRDVVRGLVKPDAFAKKPLTDALFSRFWLDTSDNSPPTYRSIAALEMAIEEAKKSLDHSSKLPYRTPEERNTKVAQQKIASDNLAQLEGLWQQWQDWSEKWVGKILEKQEALLDGTLGKETGGFHEPIIIRCEGITVEATIRETSEKFIITVARAKTDHEASSSK